MHLDVEEFRKFYYQSSLGRAAQRAVRDRLLEFWPNATGQTVAGFGFAVPLLRPFLSRARRVIALMPAAQGVMPWPAGGSNISVLSEETQWPLETGHVDRLVIMHGLETSEDQPGVLDEAYRVLGPGGRVIFVVANRAGLWSRGDHTPMGYGRPYTLRQLENYLEKYSFIPERHATVLYQPPSEKRFWRRAGPMLERVGRRLPVFAGGLIMVEASKQVPARPRPKRAQVTSGPLELLEGFVEPKPAMKPVLEKSWQERSGIAEADKLPSLEPRKVRT